MRPAVTRSASCRTVKSPTEPAARLQQRLLFLLEPLAGKAEEHQHDADVDDVAAVAALRAADQADHRGEEVGAGRRLARTCAPRTNSCPIVAVTNAHSAKQMPRAPHPHAERRQRRAGDQRRRASATGTG